jgi:hypothetical protein
MAFEPKGDPLGQDKISPIVEGQNNRLVQRHIGDWRL